MRLATQALDRKPKFPPQVRKVQAAQIPHVHVLQVVPDAFPRVEVRGIGRELLQVNLPGSPFGQKRAHVPLVNGRAIPDHQQFLRYMRQQVLEKDHAIEAVQRVIAHQGVEPAVHRNAAHDRHMVAGVHRAQDGGLSAGRIGADPAPARDKSQTRPQRQWFALRCVPFFELWPHLDPPLVYHRFIALGGARDRQLGRPVEAPQQSRDMRLVVRDAELLPDHRRHPGTGPKLATKSVGFGTMGSQLGHQMQLVECELDGPCRSWLAPPSFTAAHLGFCHPLADRGG
jgi:hypothetical protein